MYTIKQIALIASRDLRRRQTAAEKIFWDKIKDKKFLGYKFLRQHPLFYEYYDKKKFFIADFYCRDLKLVVDIDGGIHEQQADYDKIRTEILETQKSYKVIRYNNNEVVENINKVLINLKSVINSIDRKKKI
jgi:very-short-patch-repair endonuclease